MYSQRNLTPFKRTRFSRYKVKFFTQALSVSSQMRRNSFSSMVKELYTYQIHKAGGRREGMELSAVTLY